MLKRAAIRDPMIGNMVACTMLVPDGWNIDSGLVWIQNPFYPVSAKVAIARPDTLDGAFIYPHLLFIDGMREGSAKIGGAWLASHYPEGSQYLGNEVRRQVNGPVSYVGQFILPRFRQDLRGAKVAGTRDLPEYAKAKLAALGEPAGLKAQSTRVRLAYKLQGQEAEEDFVTTLYTLPGVGGTVHWGGECESYRAARGQLDAEMPLLHTVLSSFSLDLHWFAQVCQVGELMKQGYENQSNNALELSKHLAANQAEISESIRSAYKERERTLDQCNKHFDQYIRGVEEYNNPFDANRTLEVPSGYNHVFVNSAGDVVVSNRGDFKPNQVVNGNWQEVHTVK